MSYSLRTEGLALDLLSCVMVDEDGTTIKDFIAGTGFSVDGGAGNIETGSWKGTTRQYQPTAANGNYNYYGLRFSTPPTIPTDAAGGALFLALHNASAGSGGGDIIDTSDSGGRTNFDRAGAGGLPRVLAYGYVERTGNTVWPTDGTKFSAGFNHRRNVEASIWYCLESVNATDTSKQFDATGGQDDTSGAGPLHGIGGLGGMGNSPVGVYLSALFDRVLTVAEFRTLHDDWFGTLFTSGPPPFKSYFAVNRNQAVMF